MLCLSAFHSCGELAALQIDLERIHNPDFSWISVSIRTGNVVAGFSPRSAPAYGQSVPKANAG